MNGRFALRSLLRWLCAAALAGEPLAHAAPAVAGPPRAPRIGLALSGGGARGAAHIGVLRVLEEHRIPVDCIAGTSMGALVGGLYASGLTPAQLDSVVSNTNWPDTFADNIPRGDRSFRRKRDDDLYLVKHKPGIRGGKLLFPPGMLDGHRVDLLLKRLSLPVVTVRDFDSLSIPYRAIAADIVNGDSVVLDHGDLALAMRASMSIPGAFAPRVIDERLLVDGGIVDNFPIEVVRRMGADVVIAVDISSPGMSRAELNSVPAISTQLATLASDQNKKRQIASLTAADVFIRPDLGSITVASFDRAAEAVAIGERAALAALPALERYAVSPEEYAEHQAERRARVAAARPVVLGGQRIVNRSRLSDRVLAARLDAPVGERLDLQRLEQDLDEIYGLELFESVYYDIAPGPRGDLLTVTARERSWGPDYLQGGVAVFEDFEGPNFNVALAYSRTGVNRLNGEWRTGLQVGQEPGAWSEFYQPLDERLRTFAHVGLSGVEQSINVFDRDGHKTSELGITRFGAMLAGGRELGAWGELRAGILREGGRISVQVGDASRPASHYDAGEWFAQFFVDKLDEVAFPHRGGMFRARVSGALDALGSSVEFQQGVLEASVAGTSGHFTGLLGGELGATRDSNAPLAYQFRLGGLGQLSGLEQDELVGPHALLLRSAVYGRVRDFQLLPVYGGLTGEYGNVYPTRSAIELKDGLVAGSVFLGVDTPLGPLCVAYGRAERDRGNYYLTLGQPLGGRRPGFQFR